MTAGGRNVSRTSADRTLGIGRNAPGGKARSRSYVGAEGREDREHAILVRADRRDEPVRHLDLQHERRVENRAAHDEPPSSIANRIGDAMLYGRLPATRTAPCRDQAGEVLLENVADNDGRVGESGLLESRGQIAIDLNRR